ncbi:N2227-like protein-domain-containing protein [Coprinopsis sp. MPI-PUGE-AT-0042]|nr:N2227-like protein-domain-containing protein [Coprinopsis sp. MPI-PUGE-AT-0042]
MSATHFDILLAILFPLAICIVGYRLKDRLWNNQELKQLLWPSNTNAPLFGLERAYYAYLQYESMSKNELARMKNAYGKLGRAHKNLGHKLNYPKKLQNLFDATSMNGTVADGVAECAANDYSSLASTPRVATTYSDLGRVREALKHYLRDWSSEGASEREVIFSPILDVLKLVPEAERGSQKVLVPGSGLGRLAWEISQLGFDTTANELSYFMILAFRRLLSIKHKNEYKIRPFAHWWSHQRKSENLFRAVSFPDALPRLGPNFHLIEGDFLKIQSLSPKPTNPDFWKKDGTSDGTFDFIITLFFIDTSTNIFATLEQIHRLLRPGGTWINLGPLLWTGGAQSCLELSYEEVLEAATHIGFSIKRGEANGLEQPRMVECQYTADPNAMMRWTYKAEFWVASKVK